MWCGVQLFESKHILFVIFLRSLIGLDVCHSLERKPDEGCAFSFFTRVRRLVPHSFLAEVFSSRCLKCSVVFLYVRAHTALHKEFRKPQLCRRRTNQAALPDVKTTFSPTKHIHLFLCERRQRVIICAENVLTIEDKRMLFAVVGEDVVE